MVSCPKSERQARFKRYRRVDGLTPMRCLQTMGKEKKNVTRGCTAVPCPWSVYTRRRAKTATATAVTETTTLPFLTTRNPKTAVSFTPV